MDWVACNVGDYDPRRWDSVRSRASSMGIYVIPWARLAHPELGEGLDAVKRKLEILVDCGNTWPTKIILPNYESEAKTVLPKDVWTALIDTGWMGDVGWSMQGWLFNDTDYSPLASDPVLLQIFPADLKWTPDQIPQKMEDCVVHARSKGFTYVGVTYQSYGIAEPSWFELDIPHSVYTGNTIPATDWPKWFP